MCTRKVQELNGKAAFTCSFKRSLKAKILAFTSAVKVTGEQTIDPALLLQCVLVVSQSGDIVAVVRGKGGKSLHSLRSSVLTRKVISSKAFVKAGETPSYVMCYDISFAQELHSGYDMDEEAMDATLWIQRTSCCL